MQTAAYGIYKNGQIILDEPAQAEAPARVLVVFLENQKVRKSKLADFFKLYGAWEDKRGAEAIIKDIYNSRLAKADIKL
ncbi:hypothetical protein NO1_1422 [Candidatus Termititenax aidoneus]|uniref:Uncharacterized protein n=1 Tax=Termititenax aidoneus TaxID=2218524 RepID=A0A388TCJ1_TERA1|nr:hypothetical protein NO1_1422 [Candidatus Termititenax aidoneus]